MKSKSLLIILGCILAVGLGILAIDKFVVDRNEPPEADQYQAVAEDLGFELITADEGSKVIDRLRASLTPFNTVLGAAEKLGPAMVRIDSTGTVTLFEYGVRQTAIDRVGAQPDQQVDITLLGILIDFSDSIDLPKWKTGEALPQPPFTPEGMARLLQISDLDMSFEGAQVLFTSRQETWALKQAVNQSISSEFHPGLLNSSLKIDVQRAIDVVNMLEADQPDIPRVYKIDVKLPDIDVPKDLGLTNKFNAIQQDMEKKLEAQRKKYAEQDAARKAAWQKTLEESRAKMQKNIDKSEPETPKPPAESEQP